MYSAVGSFFKVECLVFIFCMKRFFKPLETEKKPHSSGIYYMLCGDTTKYIILSLCSKYRYLFHASLEWHHENNSQCIVFKQIILFCILLILFLCHCVCYVVLIAMNSDRRVVGRASLVVCVGFSLALGHRLSRRVLVSVPVNLYLKNSCAIMQILLLRATRLEVRLN